MKQYLSGFQGKHAADSRAMHIPYWLIAVLLVMPAAGVVWFGFVSSDPLPIDHWWHTNVVASEGAFSFVVASVLHVLGSTKVMAIIGVILTLLLLAMRRLWEAIAIASTLLGVLIITKLIKFLVDRPRPVDMLVEQDETSFPSGHTLGAAALMVILVCIVYSIPDTNTLVRTVATAVAVLYVVAMAWSRTALHVHWISDTLAGALIGTAVALLSARLFLRVPEQRLEPLPGNSDASPQHLA